MSARLAALRNRPLNYEPAALGGPGWQRDDYRQALPCEEPGPPQPGGSWEIAGRLSRSYAFSDPSLVEGIFDSSVPLEQRELLLVLHVLGARVYAGVRVGDAGEETRTEEGAEARVSFWNYRTLEGHVEAGQRDFEVWKWPADGRVEFRTHSISRPAESSVVVRSGFRLLGRHKQVEFGRRACARMAFLTEAALRNPNRAPGTKLDGRLLSIYLRDHHTLLVATRQLGARLASRKAGDEVETFGEELRAAAGDDVVAVEELLRRLDSTPSRLRTHAAVLGELAGRLKLNGRLISPSPLSPVLELEGSALLLAEMQALWTSLDQAGLGPEDGADRAARAVRLAQRADELRLRLFERAVRARC